MKPFTGARTYFIAVLWALFVPSQPLLGGLLGDDKGGLLGTGLLAGGDGGDGKGGLLGAVGGDSKGGLLGAVGGAGEGGLLSAVGGDGKGGLLSAVGGDGKGGLLDAVGGAGEGGLLSAVGGGEGGGLLGSTTGSLLGGGEGGSPLSGILGGKDLLGGDLLGNSLLGGLTGLGSGASQQPHSWFDTLNLKMLRGSWKILRGTELVLNLQATLSLNLPGMPSLLNGLSMEMNTTAHLAITQDKPGDLKLILRNCPDLVAGFSVKLPSNLIADLLNGFINSAIRTILPPMMCPVFQIWLSVVNLHLRVLNDYYYWGLLGKIHSVMSRIPYSTGQFSEVDLKETPFPAVFVNWLINFAHFADGKKAQ